jgi:hypothetical protein
MAGESTVRVAIASLGRGSTMLAMAVSYSPPIW